MSPQEAPPSVRNLDKAALRGEPSYVWRDGQERRLALILEAAGGRQKQAVLVNGCGVGTYLFRLGKFTENIVGLDIEFERLQQAKIRPPLRIVDHDLAVIPAVWQARRQQRLVQARHLVAPVVAIAGK